MLIARKNTSNCYFYTCNKINWRTWHPTPGGGLRDGKTTGYFQCLQELRWKPLPSNESRQAHKLWDVNMYLHKFAAALWVVVSSGQDQLEAVMGSHNGPPRTGDFNEQDSPQQAWQSRQSNNPRPITGSRTQTTNIDLTSKSGVHQKQ